MGNFEKLVVLTVLFLSAIVLAISLNDGKKKGERNSPLGAARTQQEQEKDAGVQAAEKRNNGLLLNTEITPGAAPSGPAKTANKLEAKPQRSADGRLRILSSDDGLRSAGIEDYKVYTAADGDTWAGLSERFYDSGRYVSLLRHANEDMMRPLEGEAVLVPVYDFAEEAGKRAPLTPEVRVSNTASELEESKPLRRESSSESAAYERAPATTTTNVATLDLTGVSEYEVRPGDSLSGIAQKVYGSGSRWNVIFEANRNLLKSPDWLQVGMTLAIPRGERLQSLAASVKETEAAERADTKKKGRVR